jgi:hypothetical protein
MRSRFQTGCLGVAIAAFPLLIDACVNTTKPSAVALCAATNSCTDHVSRDADGAGTRDALAADQAQAGTRDGAFPPPADAGERDVPGAVADATRADVVGAADLVTSRDSPREIAPGSDDVPVGGDDVGVEAMPDRPPEIGPEATRDRFFPGAEPASEPRPEPGPEPAPEPPPDAGSIASCPSGGICDDFEDGNCTATPAWTVPGGFAVSTDGSKVLAYTGTDSPAVALVGSKATALTIKAKVKATAFGGTSNSYRVGVFARANSQGTPSAWYGFTITGDGSLRLQVTDSTPSGCSAVDLAAVAGTWYILTLTVSGTVASTTLQGTFTDVSGGNTKIVGPCTITNGLAAGWAGVGVRGGGTQGEWDDVQITGITP